MPSLSFGGRVMLRNRIYKTGSRYAFWRWTDTDSDYLTRLHLLKTPWFAVCLHWLHKPDPEPYLHDHPVSFVSLILRGAYTEVRHEEDLGNGYFAGYVQTNRWYNFFRATSDDRHTIVGVAPNTLTLCFMGPKVREWAFHLPSGPMYWKEYYKLKRQGVQP